MIRPFRRCGHAPGTLSAQDQTVVDQFRATLTALRNPQPWAPGRSQDIAVRIGPFVERAHTRPGDDHSPEMIAVALVHPAAPHAAAYRNGRQLGYTERGWLRCQTSSILGIRQPSYETLTHAAANLLQPDDLGMDPARYALCIEARKRDDSPDGHTLLRLGPYTQTGHAQQDHDRLTAALDRQETTLVPGRAVRPPRCQRSPAVHQPVRDRRSRAPEHRSRGVGRVTAQPGWFLP
ncbi:hypothetical protein ACIQVA_35255 [Streptomyces microflavus]|uniref:hypothetical protein n=1 Tax=Streptomyces microflavus TaxID=1919 RepID=UPI0038229F7A